MAVEGMTTKALRPIYRTVPTPPSTPPPTVVPTVLLPTSRAFVGAQVKFTSSLERSVSSSVHFFGSDTDIHTSA